MTLPYAVELANRGLAGRAARRPCAGARAQHPRRRGHLRAGRGGARPDRRRRSTRCCAERAAGEPRRRPLAARRGLARPPAGRARAVGQHACRLPARPAPATVAFLAEPRHHRRRGGDRARRHRVPRRAARRASERASAARATSAARTLVAVRGFHRFLALEGEATADPASAVPPPRPPKRLPKAISVAEVERLLEAASVGDTPAALRDRALLEVLYGGGARISEAVGLDVDDVDLGGSPASVRLLGKGRQGADRPAGQVRGRGARRVPRPRAARCSRCSAAARRRCSSTRAAAGCPGRVPGRPAAGGRPGRPRRPRVAAHAAALVRHAPARGRGRRARRPGAARATPR